MFHEGCNGISVTFLHFKSLGDEWEEDERFPEWVEWKITSLCKYLQEHGKRRFYRNRYRKSFKIITFYL